MIIEESDYIDALTPFKNGCDFSLIIDKDNNYYLCTGCDCRPFLLTDIKRFLYDLLYEKNKEIPIKLNISTKTKEKLLRTANCKCCGGAKFEKR